MIMKQFDAMQEALQYYKKEGYDYDFSEESIAKQNPEDWKIKAIHSFKDLQNPYRSHMVYVLHSVIKEQKGVIVKRFGTLALPYKALFLKEVALEDTLRDTPSV